MSDEVQRLRTNGELFRLLTHYAKAGVTDREAWQDRLMQMAGVAPRDLVALHGELIAFDWIAQNTGITPVGKPGVVAQCYRITAAGLRALRRTCLDEDEEDDNDGQAA